MKQSLNKSISAGKIRIRCVTKHCKNLVSHDMQVIGILMNVAFMIQSLTFHFTGHVWLKIVGKRGGCCVLLTLNRNIMVATKPGGG